MSSSSASWSWRCLGCHLLRYSAVHSFFHNSDTITFAEIMTILEHQNGRLIHMTYSLWPETILLARFAELAGEIMDMWALKLYLVSIFPPHNSIGKMWHCQECLQCCTILSWDWAPVTVALCATKFRMDELWTVVHTFFVANVWSWYRDFCEELLTLLSHTFVSQSFPLGVSRCMEGAWCCSQAFKAEASKL